MCENSLDCEALSHAMMCDGTRSTKRSRRVAEASFLVIVWRCLALSFVVSVLEKCGLPKGRGRSGGRESDGG